MSEELQKQEETPAESGTERVFTQEEMNTLVGQANLKERGKYKDFESYKASHLISETDSHRLFYCLNTIGARESGLL